MTTLIEQLKDVADFLEEFQGLNPDVRHSPDGDRAYVIDADLWEAFEDDAAKFHAPLLERIRELEAAQGEVA